MKLTYRHNGRVTARLRADQIVFVPRPAPEHTVAEYVAYALIAASVCTFTLVVLLAGGAA